MSRFNIFLFLLLSFNAYCSPVYYVESKEGSAMLSEEKCWADSSKKEAIIPSQKMFPKVSILGCWEEKSDGYIYIEWLQSIGADRSVINIHTNEKIKSPKKSDDNKNEINSNEECASIYQAWVFNSTLETGCYFKGNLSEKMGVAAKEICGNKLSEKNREQLTTEVLSSIKADLESVGEEEFCASNEKQYYQLLSK